MTTNQTVTLVLEPTYQSYQKAENRWAILDKLATTSDIDKKLSKLERRALRLGHGFTRGTIISRVCCDVPTLIHRGVKVPKELLGNEAITVWSLGLGGLNEPKAFFIGLTVNDTIKQANEYLSYVQKNALKKPAKKLSFVTKEHQMKYNDNDRHAFVDNDEWWYRRRHAAGGSMRAFLKAHREEIDEAMRATATGKRRAHEELYGK